MATKVKRADSEAGRYAYGGLDRVLHERARLGIVIALSRVADSDGLTFTELKLVCALTDGNLSRHLQMLEESGVVVVAKDFVDRRPRTLCRLSSSGWERLHQYRVTLQQVQDDLEFDDSILFGAQKFGADVAVSLSSEDVPADSWVPAWDQ